MIKYNYLKGRLAPILSILFLIFACNSYQEQSNNSFEYSLHIDSTFNRNAPSLQSFAHASVTNEWLLFAGRTNQSNSNGGLHFMNGNYTNTSFPPVSYNDSVFVYNLDKDIRIAISIQKMMSVLKSNFPENYKAVKGFESIFRNSNSLVRQDGEFLYVIGGYGPADFKAKGQAMQNYTTYNQVGKIHVPSLINLVKGEYTGVEAAKLFSFGKGKNLTTTGGELIKIGNVFYAVTGHCFGINCTPFQKYQDAAYPFTISKDTLHTLTLTQGNPITDVMNPTLAIADDLSIFRRRDQPIIPAIYKSPVNQKIQEGIAIYSGVFKPGEDINLQAWNDAIYIHPSWANNKGRLFTQDVTYNQKSFNVYACPSFVMYDSISDKSHTFLLGGIGDGALSKNGFLSGFTNTAIRIETNIGVHPLKSNYELIQPVNLFNKRIKNTPPFYGAEAVLFPNKDLPLVRAAYVDNFQLKEQNTEIVNLNKINSDEILIGYIYGGIEAFESNPATYGPSKSRASNVVFKVTLRKK